MNNNHLLTVILFFLFLSQSAYSQVCDIDFGEIPFVTTDESCPGAADGSIMVNAVSSNIVEYGLEGEFQSSPIFTGLSTGFYLIEIRDIQFRGCMTSAFDSVGLVGSNIFVESFSINESYAGASDGAAEVFPAGGSPPYAYEWSNGATTKRISGLGPGEYTLTITDANGCTAMDTLTVIQGPCNEFSIYKPSPSYTGPLYEGDPLTLIANPPDEGPYNFYWTGPNGFSSTQANPVIGSTDMDHTGIYSLQITDDNNCDTSVSINVEVVEDKIGMQYDNISMNYKNYGLYPFEFLCNSCCCPEDESSTGLISPPGLIDRLSEPEKLTSPNVKGPPACETEFNSYTGNFMVKVPALSISGLGPELSINFIYNTCNRGINFGYGNGWTFNYNLVWERVGADIHVYRGDGREDIFQFNAGSYLSPKGISDTLILLGDDRFLLRSKHGMVYHFTDPSHRRLTKVRDRNNNELIISFTDSLATEITGACGRSYELEYNGGFLTSIKDNNSSPARSVKFEYDANRNLTRIKDPLGYAEDFIYDIDRLIVQLIDKRRNVVQAGYNSGSAITSLESGISQIFVTYDAANKQTIVLQPVGDSIQTTTFTFDGEGRVTQISGSCCAFDIQYQYNSKNDITRITDATGYEYNYTYDGKGNVLTEKDPLNYIQEFDYDPKFNRMIQWKDKNGNPVSYAYDSSGNVLSVTQAPGVTWTYTYYDNGLLKSSTDGEGFTTSLGYNNCGNPISIAYPIGTESFEYDGLGNIIKSVTPNGDATSYEFDLVRQQVRETDPLGNSIERFLDPNGNEILTKNKRGYVTTRTYDAHNRPVKITEPLETITEFGYDEKGNLVSRKDPNGNETRFAFDHRNLMVSETNALGNTRFWDYDANGNLMKETNFRGFSTTYVYDELNRRISIVDALGDSTTYQYDANGNNIKVLSPDGVASVFQYDELDRLIKTQHAFDQYNYTYDKNGNLIEEEDVLGNTTSYEYDANDRLIREIDALGQETTNQYDDNGNQIAETDKMGNKSQTIYDALDRPVSHINALGDSVRMSYDEAGNLKTLTNERGFATQYIYDELDRVTSIQYPIGMESFVYDKKGNQIKETDPLGRVTSYQYDAINYLIATVYADGSSTKQSFDENGNTISSTNEENDTDQFSYDALDRLSSSTNAEHETTSLTYDNLSNKKTVFLPSGDVVQYVYDSENRLIASYDKLGRLLKFTYDHWGNILTETDGNGNTTTLQYDGLGRLITTTDPNGDITQYAYDKNDNLLQTTDREGNVTLENYDVLDRSIGVTDARGNTTGYSYDKSGNIISITDSEGNATTYEWDAMDRQTKENYADGTTRVYTYDVFGNVLTRNDNNGNVTSYAYDQRNRLTLIDYPGANDDRFMYDFAGLLASASNSNAILSFGYDKADRLLFENINGDITNYTYDIPNQQRTINYSQGNQIIKETMDERGRLKQVQLNGNVIANWLYDGADLEIFSKYANGTKSQNVLNTRNWITSVQHYTANGILIHLTYAFDKEGNKRYENNFYRPDRSESYAYDNNYRLTQFRRGMIQSGNYSHQSSFDYDPLGNRVQVIRNSVLTTYASNEMNEYTSISGMFAPVYDANGNLTNDGTFTYQYDYENRLISVDGGTVATYEYDPLGRRVSKTTTAGTTRYIYDGPSVIEEKDGSGNLKASYLYGAGIDNIIVMQRGGKDYYYHTNSLGSVIALTSTSGNPNEYYEYDAFGRVAYFDNNHSELSQSAIDNPYLFTGRRLDEETELYYYRARHYDALNGRFLQRDPLDYNDAMNLYQYTGNNPINWLDPFGDVIIIPTSKGSKKLKKEKENLDDLKPFNQRKTLRKALEKICPCFDINTGKVKGSFTTVEMSPKLKSKNKTYDFCCCYKTNRAGCNLLWILNKSNNQVRIWGRKGGKGDFHRPSNGNSNVGFRNHGRIADEDGKPTKGPLHINLGHELVHALRVAQGKYKPVKNNRSQRELEEGQASAGENQLREAWNKRQKRKKKKIDLRGKYRYKNKKGKLIDIWDIPQDRPIPTNNRFPELCKDECTIKDCKKH